MNMKTISTSRYDLSFREREKGGPAGYESAYLTSEGDPAGEDLYRLFDKMGGVLLPAKIKNIRQRNGLELVNALKYHKTVGIASGFKPSGAYHFGHKLTSGAVSFFQKNGAQIFMPIADIECEMDKRVSREDYLFWAADNLLDWGANGVNLDATHVYFQSEERKVSNLAYIAARGLTFDLAIDIYGFEKLCGNPEKKDDRGEFPFLFAGVTQVGDILLPQHPEFGNYHSFMVSGQDQDGHMKMTIELVKRAIKEERVIPGLQTVPSGFYIPHMRGLEGKASSSKHNTTLYLGAGPFRLDLEDRIKKSLDMLDEAYKDGKTRRNVMNCTLDMAMYIDIFNDESIVNFSDLILNMPCIIKKQLKDLEGDIGGRINLFDLYLIEESRRLGQDNFDLVRSIIPKALKQHQKKRQEILEYAKRRADYKNEAWNIEDNRPTQPEYWEIPKEAVVDQTKRNSTEWFHIVNSTSEKIIT